MKRDIIWGPPAHEWSEWREEEIGREATGKVLQSGFLVFSFISLLSVAYECNRWNAMEWGLTLTRERSEDLSIRSNSDLHLSGRMRLGRWFPPSHSPFLPLALPLLFLYPFLSCDWRWRKAWGKGHLLSFLYLAPNERARERQREEPFLSRSLAYALSLGNEWSEWRRRERVREGKEGQSRSWD